MPKLIFLNCNRQIQTQIQNQLASDKFTYHFFPLNYYQNRNPSPDSIYIIRIPSKGLPNHFLDQWGAEATIIALLNDNISKEQLNGRFQATYKLPEEEQNFIRHIRKLKNRSKEDSKQNSLQIPVNLIPVPSLIVDKSQQTIVPNQAFCNMVQASREEIQLHFYQKEKNSMGHNLVETILDKIQNRDDLQHPFTFTHNNGSTQTFTIRQSSINNQTCYSFLQLADWDNSDHQWYQRLQYQKLISEITELSIVAESLDDFLQTAIEKIGIITGVSRVYIFENFDKNQKTRNTHEWVNNGIEPSIQMFQDTSYSDFKVWKQILTADQVIYASEIISELDPELHDILTQQQIKSILVVPLWINNKWYGFLGLDECKLTREWSKNDISLLRSLAHVIELTIINNRIRRENEKILQALQQSEHQKKTILSSTPYGIALIRNRKIIWHNKSFRQMFDYTEEEMRNLSTRQLLHDFRCIDKTIQLSDGDTNQFKSERSFKRKDGTMIHCLINGSRLDFNDDESPAVLVIFTDISDLRKAQLALSESEQKYSTLVERSNDGIVVLRDEGIFEFVNQRFCEITGFQRRELLGKNFVNFVPLETRQFLNQRYHDRMQNKNIPDIYESKILSKSGQSIDVEISAKKIHFHNTDMNMIYIRDIRKRKQLENQVRFQATTLDHAGIFVFVTDTSGTITYVNQTVYEVFNLTEDSIKNKKISDIIRFPADIRWQDLMTRFQQDQSIDIEVTAKSDLDKELPVLLTLVSLHNDQHEIDTVTAIGKDISDLKIKETKLRQNNKELKAYNEIAKVITDSYTSENLLHNILQSILKLLEIDSGAIFLLNEPQQELRMISYSGLSADLAGKVKFIQTEKNDIFNRLQSDQIQIITNFAENDLYLKNDIIQEGIQTVLVFPLINKKKNMGIICLGHHSSYNLSIEKRRLLNKLKYPIGIAVNNILLNTELQNRARRMTALSRAIMATNRLADINNLMPEFARILVTDLGFSHSWIALKDEKTNTLKTATTYGINITKDINNLVIPLDYTGNCPPLGCLKNGKPVIFHRADTYPVPAMQNFIRDNRIESLFYVPISRHDEITGVVGVTQSNGLPLDQNDIDAVTYFAGQIHIALENAKLYNQTQSNYRKVTRLQQMSQKMTSTLKLHEVLTFICRSMVEILGYEASWIGLNIPPYSTLSPVTHYNVKKQYFKKIKNTLAKDSSILGPLARVLRQKSPIVVRNLHNWNRAKSWQNEMEKFQYESAAAFPLLVNADLKGILVIYCKARSGFPESEIPIIDTFVAQAAVAIKNALLFEESQKYAQEIENKNKELESFVYTVSHDLKAPLISLNGFTSLLLDLHREKFTGDTLFYLERIAENIHQMEHLISDLLDLSRIGRVVGKQEKISIRNIVDDIITSFYLELEGKKIELIIPKKLPEIIGDKGRIKQVFENLIHNAIKFCQQGKKNFIKIHYSHKPSLHEFAIQDNGIGIAAEHQAKIFDLFYSLNPENNEGTGIGLTITKRIIEHHGGQIWLTSKPNQGTTFHFTLPERER